MEGWFAGLPEDVWRQHVWPALFTPCSRMRSDEDEGARFAQLLREAPYRQTCPTPMYDAWCRHALATERQNTDAWHRCVGVCAHCLWPHPDDGGFAGAVTWPRAGRDPTKQWVEVPALRTDLRTARALMRTCRTFCTWTRLYTPLWMRALVMRAYAARWLARESELKATDPQDFAVLVTPALWWRAFGLQLDDRSPELHDRATDVLSDEFSLRLATVVWRLARTQCAGGARRWAALMCAPQVCHVEKSAVASVPAFGSRWAFPTDPAAVRDATFLLRAVLAVDSHRRQTGVPTPMLPAYAEGAALPPPPSGNDLKLEQLLHVKRQLLCDWTTEMAEDHDDSVASPQHGAEPTHTRLSHVRRLEELMQNVPSGNPQIQHACTYVGRVSSASHTSSQGRPASEKIARAFPSPAVPVFAVRATAVMLLALLVTVLTAVLAQPTCPNGTDGVVLFDIDFRLSMEDVLTRECQAPGQRDVGLCRDIISVLGAPPFSTFLSVLDAGTEPDVLQSIQDVAVTVPTVPYNASATDAEVPGDAVLVYNATAALWEARQVVPVLPYALQPRTTAPLDLGAAPLPAASAKYTHLDMVIGADGLPLLVLVSESVGLRVTVVHCARLDCSAVDSVEELATAVLGAQWRNTLQSPTVRALVLGDGHPMLVLPTLYNYTAGATYAAVTLVYCQDSLLCAGEPAVAELVLDAGTGYLTGSEQYEVSAVTNSYGYATVGFVSRGGRALVYTCLNLACTNHTLLANETLGAVGAGTKLFTSMTAITGVVTMLVPSVFTTTSTAAMPLSTVAVQFERDGSVVAVDVRAVASATVASQATFHLVQLHRNARGALEVFRGTTRLDRQHCVDLFHCEVEVDATGPFGNTATLSAVSTVSAAETTDGQLYVLASPAAAVGDAELVVCGGRPGATDKSGNRCDRVGAGTDVQMSQRLTVASGDAGINLAGSLYYRSSRVRIGSDGVPLLAWIYVDAGVQQVAVRHCGNRACTPVDAASYARTAHRHFGRRVY